MKTMLSWEPDFLSPPMIISHPFPFCLNCDLACPKAKTQSLTWFAIISLKVGDFCVLTPTSPSFSSTPVPSQQPLTHQQHPQSYLNTEQICSNLTPLHQTVSSPAPRVNPLGIFSLWCSTPVQTKCNTCSCSSHMTSRPQSAGILGVVRAPWYHSWLTQ